MHNLDNILCAKSYSPSMKRVKLLCLIYYTALSAIVLYLRFFPNWPPIIADVFFSICLFLVIAIPLYLFRQSKSRLIQTIAVTQLIVVVAVVRLTLPIRFGRPISGDGWRFLYVFEQLRTSGTLTPPDGRYWGTNFQLGWPAMYTFTAIFTKIFAIGSRLAQTLYGPFVGIGLFGAIFAFGSLTRYQSTGMYAAVIGCFSAGSIYYQSEFHSQGIALVYLVLLAVSFAIKRQGLNGSSSIFIISTSAILISHHFTSILMAGVLAIFTIIFILWSTLDFRTGTQIKRSDIIILTIAVISIISYHLLINTAAILSYLRLAGILEMTASVSSIDRSTTPPLLQQIVGTMNNVVLIVFAIGGITGIYRRDEWPIVISLLLGSIATFGITFVISEEVPLNRIRDILVIIGSPLAAYTLLQIEDWSDRIGIFSPNHTTVVSILFLLLVASAGVVNAHPPMHVLQSPEEDPYYKLNNTEPNIHAEIAAGKWGIYLPRCRLYTSPDIKSLFFYTSDASWSALISDMNSYNGNIFIRQISDSNFDTIYNNGEIIINRDGKC